MLHQLSKEDVNETFQIRSALESYCTLQICKEANSRKAGKLFKEHMDILNAMQSGDVEHIYDITIQHMERPKGINLKDL